MTEYMDMSDPSDWFWTELAELNPDAVIFDGFDDCVVGYASQFNRDPVLVYDHELMIGQLMRVDDMDYSDAYEYLSFNVEGLWAGEFTPMIMRKR
jgi:hypothetical protein